MVKKVKNNKKRSVQIRNKNKNLISININSHNKRKGGSSGPRPSGHPTVIMSAPHVPYIPTDTGSRDIYPALADIKEKLAIQAKHSQDVINTIGSAPNDITHLNSVKVAPEDNQSVSSLNDYHAPVHPLPQQKPPAPPSPYTPLAEFDVRKKIPNPTGKGQPILVGGQAYKKYVKMGLIKDIE